MPFGHCRFANTLSPYKFPLTKWLRSHFQSLIKAVILTKVRIPRKNIIFAGEILNKQYMNIQPEIPQSESRADIQQREKFIKDFYAQWNAANPTKHIYNIALQDFIHVRFLSIQETAEHAAANYKSTLAVTYLTEILEKAKVVKRVAPKVNNQNQKRFSEVIVMQHTQKAFGKIKLTVGVLRGSRQHIQYCITAIENG